MNPDHNISLSHIATVSNNRSGLEDDDWGSIISKITLVDGLPAELLKGLDEFSHVEILFHFHRLPEGRIDPPTRSPRNNRDWPDIGLLAQRSAHHPNPLGMTMAKVIRVKGRILTVQGLDAIDGSPVLDIKPVFNEFLPQGVKQPPWVSELMKDYWSRS